MSTLGIRLKRAREEKGLTQQEVANILGVSNGTISGYERDYRDPDTETLKRLAFLYGVSVDYLTGNVVKESSATYHLNKEDRLREEAQKFAEMIVELPEHERKLVENLLKTLHDKK